MRVRTALLCGKHLLPMLPGGSQRIAGGGWSHYEYINRRIGEVGRTLLCVERLLGAIPPGCVRTVEEPFGGVGMMATLVQQMVNPERHVIHEIEEWCYRQLAATVGSLGGVDVRLADGVADASARSADLWLLDFPSYTTYRFDVYSSLWEALSASEAQFVLWMEGAPSRLHLHRRNYAEYFGRAVEDMSDYAAAVAAFMAGRTPFRMRGVAWHHGAAYFLVERGRKRAYPVVKESREASEGFRWAG